MHHVAWQETKTSAAELQGVSDNSCFICMRPCRARDAELEAGNAHHQFTRLAHGLKPLKQEYQKVETHWGLWRRHRRWLRSEHYWFCISWKSSTRSRQEHLPVRQEGWACPLDTPESVRGELSIGRWPGWSPAPASAPGLPLAVSLPRPTAATPLLRSSATASSPSLQLPLLLALLAAHVESDLQPGSSAQHATVVLRAQKSSF